MILQRSDGVIAVYVDQDMKPVAPNEATFVKLVYPDGRIVFTRRKAPPAPKD